MAWMSFFVAVVAVISFCPASRSETVSWIGTTDGSWQNPSNWNTSSVPSVNDTVVINPHTNLNISLNHANITINTLYLGAINSSAGYSAG